MQKLILLVGLFLSASAVAQLCAQSINNKTWKTYIDAPISDSAILNIRSDSSFITNTAGQVMVRHHCEVNGDTLTIEDYTTDEQGCPGIKGIYKITFSGESFTLKLVSDPCDGRSHALAGRKWIEAKK